MIKELIQKIYHSHFFSHHFHTLVHELHDELRDCQTVLDLGCGPSSPLQYCTNVRHSVGVEVFQPYLEESKRKGIHSEYTSQRIDELNYSENSFDAVILIEVIEHLPEEIGMSIIDKAKKWARKKVIISSPNGFVAQKEVDGNPYQKHLSGWDYKKMKSLGFQSRGLAGVKYIRQEVEDDTMGDNLLTSIRFRPKFFWFIIATLSQLVVYHIPRFSFGLLSIYKKSDK